MSYAWCSHYSTRCVSLGRGGDDEDTLLGKEPPHWQGLLCPDWQL
jgi:hypothetical protein